MNWGFLAPLDQAKASDFEFTISKFDTRPATIRVLSPKVSGLVCEYSRFTETEGSD